VTYTRKLAKLVDRTEDLLFARPRHGGAVRTTQFPSSDGETFMPKKSDGPEASLVVAYDGSLTARSAAEVATQIARSQNLLIRGLYVIDERLVFDPYVRSQAELGGTDPLLSPAELTTRLKNRGGAALPWLESQCRGANVTVTTSIEFGGVPEVILQEAAPTTLLALGRRGHGHAANPDHLGRNFRAIAHHTRQPLLVGGDETRFVRRVLLAYNGSERAHRALAWASLLQRTLSTPVVVLAIEEDETQTQRWSGKMQARLARSDLVDYCFIRRSGQPGTHIVAVAAESQVDLIVMGGSPHGDLLEWLIGSTVDQVLRHTPLPVLVA
jgi:nucleotide-binding universal stress UspA family protein